MADQYTAEVGVDTSDMQREIAAGTKSLNTLAQAIDLASTRMQRFQQQSARSFNMSGMSNGIGNIAMPNMQDVRSQVRALAKAGVDGIGADISVIRDQEKVFASYASSIAVAGQENRDFKKSQDAAYASYAPNIRASQQLSEAQRQQTRVFEQSAAAQTAYAAQAQRNGVAYGQEVSGSLNETRYALYDVASTWASVSAATLGAVYAIESVGVAYESAFTGVERTSGAVGARLGELRDNLVNMSTAMPSSFAEIADVATLGGQLGIAEDGIEDFTETVIQLGATTNLTLEQAGTAFGRFKALLGTPEAEFSNLGSAILNVGVNSAATETQIVNVATQISSLSSLAGLTADQTVGLAGALASVGAAPELSRGTITRVFSLMNQAVAEGGEELTKFAALAGTSAADFASAWGTEAAAGQFQNFLRGIDAEGQNAIAVLNDLGITSVRDVPLLLRLADAGDVVTNAFADAATGYAENSELANQYGLVADDAASMLQILANTLKAIADEAGNLGVIKDIVAGFQQLAEAALTFVRTPIGNRISSVAVAVALVVGGFAAFRAGAALLQASTAGMIVAMNALSAAGTRNALSLTSLGRSMLTLAVGTDRATAATARLATVQNASGFGRVTAGAQAAGAAVRTMGTAVTGLVRSFAPLAAASAAIWVVTEAWNAYGESQKTAVDRSREFYGDLSGLMAAVRQDSSAEYAGEVFRELNTEMFAGVRASTDWGTSLSTAAGIQSTTAASVDATTEAVERQTLRIGENALAWTQQQVAGNADMQKIWEEYGLAIEKTGFSLEEYLRLLASSPTEAQAYITGLRDDVRSLQDEYRKSNGELKNLTDAETAQYVALGKQQAGLRQIEEQLGGTGGLFTELASQIDLAAAAGISMDDGLASAGEGMGEFGDEAENTSNKLQDLTDSLFAPIDASYALASAVSTLGESLYNNGTSFDMFTQSGQANMSALQGAISAAVTSSQGDSGVLAANLMAIMDNLYAYGVNVASEVPQLLALYNQALSLAGGNPLGGSRAMKTGQRSATGQVTMQVKAAIPEVEKLGKASIDTGKAMQQGFSNGATKAAKSAGKAGKSAKDAAAEIYSLTDYVRDLGSVFSNSFTIRFGLDESIDGVNAQFRSMQEDSQKAADAVVKAFDNLADARQDVADLNVELAELAANLASLNSDKAILQYQLGVATEYGDSLRAQEIAAELQEIEAELAKVQNDRTKTSNDLSKAQTGVTDASNELSAAQQAAIRTLTGGTASAEDQRAAVLQLVQSYQGQVQALANSGLSTDQLRTKTAELKKQFEDQLRQLGYNNAEIQRYSKAFDDMAAAINRIPRNITVSASTDPAQRAIDEFMARNTGGRGASAGVDVPVRAGGFDDSQIRKASRAAALQAQISALMPQLMAMQLNPAMAAPAVALNAQIQYLRNLLNSGNYSSGGYTGSGGKYEPAGVVHRGEYVVPKHMVNQSTGLPYASAMGRLLPGYAAGGFVNPAPSVNVSAGGMVELSPTDRALLAAAGNVTLTVDGRVLATTVNNTNTRNAYRG